MLSKLNDLRRLIPDHDPIFTTTTTTVEQRIMGMSTLESQPGFQKHQAFQTMKHA